MPFEEDEYWSEQFTHLNVSGMDVSYKEFDACVFESCDFSEATLKECQFTIVGWV